MCLYTLTLSSLWQLQGQWWYAQRWVDGLIGDEMDWFESDASTFVLDFMMALVMHDLHGQLPSFGIEHCWFVFYYFRSIVSQKAWQRLLPQVQCSQETVSQKKHLLTDAVHSFGHHPLLPLESYRDCRTRPGTLRMTNLKVVTTIKLLQYGVDHDAPHNNPSIRTPSPTKIPKVEKENSLTETINFFRVHVWANVSEGDRCVDDAIDKTKKCLLWRPEQFGLVNLENKTNTTMNMNHLQDNFSKIYTPPTKKMNKSFFSLPPGDLKTAYIRHGHYLGLDIWEALKHSGACPRSQLQTFATWTSCAKSGCAICLFVP